MGTEPETGTVLNAEFAARRLAKLLGATDTHDPEVVIRWTPQGGISVVEADDPSLPLMSFHWTRHWHRLSKADKVLVARGLLDLASGSQDPKIEEALNETEALRAQLAAAQAERDAWRDQFNLLRTDLAWTPSEKALEIERQQRVLSEAAVTLVDAKRKLTESEATVARLREELTDWQLVADGVKHHFGCPNNATTGTQTLDEPCLRCQVASVREAARREAFDAAIAALPAGPKEFPGIAGLFNDGFDLCRTETRNALEKLRDAPPQRMPPACERCGASLSLDTVKWTPTDQWLCVECKAGEVTEAPMTLWTTETT